MFKTKKAAVALALGLAALPFSIGVAIADNGPIVHDYSNTGPAYNAPGQKSDDASSDSSGASGADSGSGSGGGSAAADDGGAPYKVKCSGGSCKAGPDIIQGYQVFGGHCARCHGESGEGSTYAPSLVDAIQGGLGQGQFTAAVAGGITQMDTTTGTYRVMPSWANNPTVMNNVTQIWAYLKARSDGKIKPGRPVPIGKSNG